MVDSSPDAWPTLLGCHGTLEGDLTALVDLPRTHQQGRSELSDLEAEAVAAVQLYARRRLEHPAELSPRRHSVPLSYRVRGILSVPPCAKERA